MSASVDSAVRVKSKDAMPGKTSGKARGDGAGLLPDFSERLDALALNSSGEPASGKISPQKSSAEQIGPAAEGESGKNQTPAELLDVLTESESRDTSLTGASSEDSLIAEENSSADDLDQDTEDSTETDVPEEASDFSGTDTAVTAEVSSRISAFHTSGTAVAFNETDAAQDPASAETSGSHDGEVSALSAPGLAAGSEEATAAEYQKEPQGSGAAQEDFRSAAIAGTAGETVSWRQADAGILRSASSGTENGRTAAATVSGSSGEAAAVQQESPDAAGSQFSGISLNNGAAAPGAGETASIYAFLNRERGVQGGAGIQSEEPASAAADETANEISAGPEQAADYSPSGDEAEGDEASSGSEYRRADDNPLSGSSARNGLFQSTLAQAGASYSGGLTGAGGIDGAGLPGTAAARAASGGSAHQNAMDVLSRPLLMTDNTARESGMFERVSAMIGRNLTDADIHLSPEGMGRLHIHLEMKDRTHAKVAIIAERQDTAQLLQDTMPKLRDSLQGSGISLDGGSEVSSDPGSSSFSRGGEGAAGERGAFRSTFRMQGASGLGALGGDEVAPAGAGQEIRVQQTRSGVDYYA